MSGSVDRAGGTSRWGERDLDRELAERYVARVTLGGMVLGVAAVLTVLSAQWLLTRSTLLLVTALPIGLLLLVFSTFSQSAAFLYGSRSDLPTVRSLRARLRSGASLSEEDRLLARALAEATVGARSRRGLVVGLAVGLGAAGSVAVWWGLASGHAPRVASYGLFAFAFVVQLVVLTSVAERIGRETAHVS